MAAGSYSSRDVSHITHFDGTNFPFWKFQLLLAVENHGMEDILNGKEAIPPPAAQDATANVKTVRANEIKAWKTKDVACRNYIISTIDEKTQRSLMECKTANQMWTRLISRYEQATTSNRHLLLHKFMSYEYEEGDDIMSHVSSITTLSSQLKDVGMDISDEQVITRIIMTLPPSYRQFVTSWNGKDDDKKTLDRLTADLLQEEIFRKMSGVSISTDESTDKAFFTSRKKGTRTSPSNTSTTHSPPKSEENDMPTKKKADCNFCRKAGRKSSHEEEACWRKEAYLEGKRDAVKEIAAKELAEKELAAKIATCKKMDYLEEDDYAFHSTTGDIMEDEHSWFIDSGATSHMTDQRQLFTSFQPIKKGERMVKGVGDSLLCATGIGDIKVSTEVDGRRLHLTLRKVLYVPGIGYNLLSVGAAADNGIQTIFDSDGVKLIYKSDGRVITTGIRKNRTLYLMRIPPIVQVEKRGPGAPPYTPVTALKAVATSHQRSKKKEQDSTESAVEPSRTKPERTKSFINVKSYPPPATYRSVTFYRSRNNSGSPEQPKSSGTNTFRPRHLNWINRPPEDPIRAERPPPYTGHLINETPG